MTYLAKLVAKLLFRMKARREERYMRLAIEQEELRRLIERRKT